MSTGKRIGFVDYQLENFHANTYLTLLRGDLKDRGYTVTACWGQDAEDGKAWAQKNDVAWVDSVEAMNDQVDAYIVLAPSNPETHLDLCKLVFPHSKPTYVDKTFAPDTATAQAIFDLADKYNVPMQTTSALRYTNVQVATQAADAEPVLHMVAWGGGSNFPEYAIHPVELVVSCMGPQATRLMRRGTGDHSQLLLDFSENRTAVINVYTNTYTPFAATLSTKSATTYYAVDDSAIFRDTASAILDLFDSAAPQIDRNESLAVRRILDAAADPAALEGFVNL